jgi:hypothetical protein
MAFRFPCPTCKRELTGSDSLAGVVVQCPWCKTVFLGEEPQKSASEGVIVELNPPGAPPAIGTDNPYRKPTPDDDASLLTCNPSEESGRSCLSFLALVLVAPILGFCLIAWLVLVSQGMPSSAPPPVQKPAVQSGKD